ncbi:MAG: hypothetical protein Rv3805c [uncultured Solirubrobacterales bacterium]|uniref:Terminal beta-(1->2)-arabinofuranosyltransferase C-terminal domain-containing protein n=1 Tax=uncultured Solirubrobacterales bacterium TaxID=768556 RepID=A0A6J4T2T3_9ACTN|nr:MAG: hypothetical protein Rv3805c [uncultured Solirubrobacterales bacterium]
MTTRLLLGVPVLLLGALAWSRRWTSEEGFVYYRIVKNALEGDGPVFNVGERVEAYAGPLWLALLALGRQLTPAGVHLEWIGVGLGLVTSAAGLAAATWAAHLLWSSRSRDRPRPPDIALPLGALVIAALPPFWDFATSGLETGLAFLWLGGSFLGLVVLGTGRGADRGSFVDGLRSPLSLAATISLGPLVRPDLTLFALAFLILLVVLERPRSRWRTAALVGLGVAIPAGYQVFRMGYFASLGPTVTLARRAEADPWGRGFAYLADFAVPYALWLPLVVLVGWAALAVRTLWRAGEHRRALLVATPLAASLVHAASVVRLGGDAMHARLLLPSVFALLLPVAVVVPTRRSAAVLAALLVPWAIVCATSLRAPAKPPQDPQRLQVNDQRRQYAEIWGYRHPVTLDGMLAVPDARPAIQRRQGLELRRLAERRRAIVVSFTGPRNAVGERLRIPRPLSSATVRAKVPVEVVAWHGRIGRVGYAAGPNVRLVDADGLVDPLAARTSLPARRDGRSDAATRLPREWVLARYAMATTPAGASFLARDPGIAAARRALRCRPLEQLVRATTAKLRPSRFFANIALALREPSLRFSGDPRVAAEEVCGRRAPE